MYDAAIRVISDQPTSPAVLTPDLRAFAVVGGGAG